MIVQEKEFFNEHWIKELLRTFEYAIDSVVITTTSPDEHFLYVNDAFKRKTGYTEQELLGKSPRILQGEKTDRKVIDRLKANLLAGEDFTGKNINYRKNGSPYIVHWCISALKDIKGETIAYISYQKEIPHSIWGEEQINLLSTVVDQIDQMVLATDLLGNIVFINNAFTHKYGYTQEDVLGKSINNLKSGKHSASFYENLWQTILANKPYHGHFINKHKNGQFFVEQKTITPLKDTNGDVRFYISIGQDITDLIHKSAEYKDKAYHDSLTSLPNRMMIDEIIDMKISNFFIEKHLFSILLIDIDNFKSVNDTYGHDKGDIVLKELAALLKSNIRKDDILARWGGEEFIVLINENIDVSKQIAQKLCNSVEQNLAVESQSITISIGVSQIKKEDTPLTFFKRVDTALYESKNSGKNRVTVK